MFINRLTFSQIDDILKKILPIVFKDKEIIDNIMMSKTVAMISDRVEISFKINGEQFECCLTDFDVDFTFQTPKKNEVVFQYRILMGKYFSKVDKNQGKVNQYLTKLDEFEKLKWEENFKIITNAIVNEREEKIINQV